MTLSTITIISGIITTLILVDAIRHFAAKKKKEPFMFSDQSWKDIVLPTDALKDFEPIKGHVEEENKARRTVRAIRRAIIRNLNDYDYRWSRSWVGLPDLIELQNIVKLRPIIKDLEDQYKKYEEAQAICFNERRWFYFISRKVMGKLEEDKEMQNLFSAKRIHEAEHPNYELCELIKSPEAEEIVQRCIDEVIGGESGCTNLSEKQ